MKKIISILLAAMMLLGLVACGGGSEDPTTPGVSTKPTAPSIDPADLEDYYAFGPEEMIIAKPGVTYAKHTEQIDGKDVYPQLRAKLTESGVDKKEPISAQLLDIYGCYPAPGDRHVGEFVPYYMKEDVLMEQDYTWKNNDFIVVQRWRDEAKALLDDVRVNKRGYEHFLEGSGETATHFIRSLITGEPSVEMVNVINNGYIDNVSEVIVELPTYIDGFGLHPQKIGNLPDAIAAQPQLSLLPLYLSGMLTSAVLGYFSIRLIDKISKTGKFGGFAYYCWGAGLLTFFLSLIA